MLSLRLQTYLRNFEFTEKEVELFEENTAGDEMAEFEFTTDFFTEILRTQIAELSWVVGISDETSSTCQTIQHDVKFENDLVRMSVTAMNE